MRKTNFFVTAIHTDSGKTLVSAILCEALKADYWKPVQAGAPSDSETVKSLISNDESRIHAEAYNLKTPESPHAAARREGIEISLDSFSLPFTTNSLVIEGAGGCLVPLNGTHFIIDIAAKFDTPVILVSNFYLGSINHTLLTIEAIQKRKLSVAGIIFNGLRNEDSERIILNSTGLKCLLHVEHEKDINRQIIKQYADRLSRKWR